MTVASNAVFANCAAVEQPVPLVSTGAVWRYLDDGSDLPASRTQRSQRHERNHLACLHSRAPDFLPAYARLEPACRRSPPVRSHQQQPRFRFRADWNAACSRSTRPGPHSLGWSRECLLARGGRIFSLQSATSLVPPSWIRATKEAVFSNGIWLVPLHPTGNGRRFYRLQTP